MAEEEYYYSDGGTIVVDREENTVDPTSSEANQVPTLRTAHFLKPFLNPCTAPSLLPSVPKIQSFSHPVKPKILFFCRSNPMKGWKEWVEKMQVTHEPAWRKAGIFDAIKCSTYYINKDNDLICRLVERWCPETNTFVFPWGEATITLEDVMVMGGFSTLGGSVSSTGCSGKSVNVTEVEKKLVESFRELKEIDINITHLRWQAHFKGVGNQMEYAGFLAVWLARHVFPTMSNSRVTQKVFPLAARISFGARIAFAPAVLAAIYRDLTLLKEKIVGCLNDEGYNGSLVKLTAPFHLVQTWAWERFPNLGPIPRMVSPGETRLARWDDYKRRLCDGRGSDVELSLDSTRDTFRWRPYAVSLENWLLPGFYVESGMWVDVDSDEELKSFARCLMVCELVGLKSCTQVYNPHRVALQFGFDQDIPVSIDVSKDSCKLAWLGYKKNLQGLRLYLPPRLHEGDVTQRYSNWWRTTSTSLHGMELVMIRKGKRKVRKMKRIYKLCDGSKQGYGKEIHPFLTTSGDGQVRLMSPLIRPEGNTEKCPHNQEPTTVAGTSVGMVLVTSPLVGTEGDTEVSLHNGAEQDKEVPVVQSWNEPTTVAGTSVEKAHVMSPVIGPEGNTEVCLHNVAEQEEEVSVVQSLDKPTVAGTSAGVAPEMEFFCPMGVTEDVQGKAPDQDLYNGGDNDDDNDYYNLFATLYLEYESRISRLKKEVSALEVAAKCSRRQRQEHYLMSRETCVTQKHSLRE